MRINVISRTADTAIPVILIQSSDVRIVQDRIEGAGASDGIDMFRSTVRLIRATVIENNNDGLGDGEGVAAFGGSILCLLSDSSGNCPLIQGNGDNGILAQGGGTRDTCAVVQPGDRHWDIFVDVCAKSGLLRPLRKAYCSSVKEPQRWQRNDRPHWEYRRL